MVKDTKKEQKYEPKYRLEDMKKEFDKLGLRFTVASILFLKNRKLTFNSLLADANGEFKGETDYQYNVMPFMACSVDADGKNIGEEKAIDIMTGWLEKGYTLKPLFMMVYEQAKLNGFFTTTDEVLSLMELVDKVQDDVSKVVATQLIKS
jgi:hypothetical protein